MTQNELIIIRRAVRTAEEWGLGRISTAREAIEDAGYRWTPDHEQAVFEAEGGW